MSPTSLGSVMVILLFGLSAISVLVAGQPTAAVQASNTNASIPANDVYSPFQGERFDVFDWSLCKNLANKHSGNVLVSPISIKLALILLFEGAGGLTAREIASSMQLPESREAVRERFANIIHSLQTVSQDYVFDISTRLVVDQSIQPTQLYASTVKTFYATDVVIANLTDARVALQDINNWVSTVTHGHVTEVLTDENKLKDSIFLVLNALYFKGTWRYPFTPSLTKFGHFYTNVGSSVEVSYMNNVGHYYYADAPELDSQILRLPYLGRKYAMYIVLPRARTGLRQLLHDVNPFVLRRRIQQLEDVPVDVSIPKFKFDFTSHLENVLRELGIRDIFDNTASLISIARAKYGGQRLVVSDFVQKAGLEVDEFGTTAFAVTEVQIGNKISDRTFHVRHPFLFFIEDETTGTVVFVGKVTNPLETSGTIEEPVNIPNLPQFPVRFGGAADSPDFQAPIPDPESPVEAVNIDDRFNFFDIELFQALITESDGNVVVSPASVKAALTTLVEGTGGRTSKEILSLLRLPSDPIGIREAAKRSLAPFKATRVGAELDIATRVWARIGVEVKPGYSDILVQHYASDIQPVNFSDAPNSANIINHWVRQQTRGHIDSIVDPGSLSADTVLLLTNALYMKGNWKTSFNREMTVIKCFHVPNQGCQDAYLMHSLSYYPYAYIPSLDADVVELPYADGQLSMMIILPDDKVDGINRLARDLSHTPINLIASSLRETEVLLTMPRFSIETKMDLKQTLGSLGVRDLFDLNANLSGIVSGPVVVGSVLHNAKIEVNEEGTIAAAVTGVAVVPLMGSTVPRVRADRPFIFILRDTESGSVLFAGRVTKPDFAPPQADPKKVNSSPRLAGRRSFQ